MEQLRSGICWRVAALAVVCAVAGMWVAWLAAGGLEGIRVSGLAASGGSGTLGGIIGLLPNVSIPGYVVERYSGRRWPFFAGRRESAGD